MGYSRHVSNAGSVFEGTSAAALRLPAFVLFRHGEAGRIIIDGSLFKRKCRWDNGRSAASKSAGLVQRRLEI
jgi:hypothetical protein